MDRVKVRGHQRAGNHYLAALIELNLFDKSDPERHHDQRGHLLPNQCLDELENPTLLNIFIYRKFQSTLDSIYRMRHRFRLTGSLEDFENKKLGCLFDTSITKCDIEINWLFKGRQSKEDVSSYFGMFPDMTLNEWWDYFVAEWLKQSWRKNVYMCRYENLITNRGRNGILRDIARALGRPIKFPTKNIKSRVGYYDKGDDSWSNKR